MRYAIILIYILCCLISPWTFASPNHNPEEILKQIRGSKQEGKKVVQLFCATCHAEKPMIELGAPKIGNQYDWQERRKAGLETLFSHTAEGFGAMPPRGGCFECTDEQLKLAIAAMLPSLNIFNKKN